MVESNRPRSAETDPGYGQLFAVLIRRRFWFLGVFCIVLGIATLKTLTEKPTYKSSMQLLVEPNYQAKEQGPLGTNNQFTDSNVKVDNATQLRLMQSTQLIRKAVDLLQSEYPNINVDEIKKSLTVAQVQDDQKVETKIFEATYTDADPKKTQKALQAMQRVYQDYNREQQRLRLVKGLAFIDAQLPNVRESLREAEAALERFRKTQNLIEPEAQVKALTDAINTIEQELRVNQVQDQELQARYNALQQKLASSPQEAIISSRLSQSSRYQALLNEIQKTDLTLAQQRLRFTDDSSVIQKLLLQRQEQLTLLQEEGQRALGGNPAQLNGTGESLMEEGQFSSIDLDLSKELLQTQTNLLALRARAQTLAQKAQQLRAELNQFPNLLAEYSRLQPNIQLKRDTLQQLEKTRQELSLQIARGGFDWQVVEEPHLGEKTGPKTMQNILLGAVVGLMLGGVAAFVREIIDDSVHSSDDLSKQIDLPLLGTIPQIPKTHNSEPIIHLPFGKPQVSEPWTIQVIHGSPSWESLDLIYKNIQLQNSVSTLRSLMITSALAGEGKSTLALGLAISAARLHQRVLLIDADLRNPTLHQQLNLPNQQGLSTLLATDTILPLHSSIDSSTAYIDILTSGPTPTDPVNLLSSHRMKELIAAFEQTYDLVVLDAPPVLGTVDAILTGSFCDAVVLVARLGRVTQTELMQATAMLSKLNMIGVIGNGAGNSTKAIA
ncbi:MAG TPA: polysaccharide biosynthesis tyrosine autokinase [Coleofasciculaceae cyanobacterium]